MMDGVETNNKSGTHVLRGDIAIIGMACLFPGAPDLKTYWENIVSKIDAVTDPPPDAWDPNTFYDPSSTANDRVYCKRGGYLGDLARFSPLDYGVMPVTVDGGEPDQWLALHVAHAALADAGYLDRPKERGLTEVILGKGTYINRGNLTVGYHVVVIENILKILKDLRPEYTENELQAIKKELKASLPPFGADTASGLIGNIIAGRIANRLDLMGPSFTVDAACASGLIATEMGIRDLLTHKCDLALVGGVHVNTPVAVFALFCQLGALSRREQIRPFDKDADGTVLAEGLGMVVLKRLEDARRDADRIYAAIKGIGTSSDGRALHVMAPRLEGEEIALRRAYEMADISPRSVGLMEAHGTATPVGDVIEVQALRRVFGERHGLLPNCALGSVKSMIGHTMPAAGIAGLIKVALALHHKILPPTLHCEESHPALELEKTLFYINSETRPWIHGASDAPRRGAVNAFGFGGVNAHAVLEEYHSDETQTRSHLLRWDTEVCVLEAQSREALVEKAASLRKYLERVPQVQLKDVAYTFTGQLKDAPYRLSIIASSVEDLGQKLTHATGRVSDPGCHQIKDTRGIYFFEDPLSRHGKLAFLFPGEGAQYTNMLLDLCLHFPEVRACFDLADRAFIDHPRNCLASDSIFPRPQGEQSRVEDRLWRIDGAVEAVLIANRAMLTLLTRLEIRPDVNVGHSTGDYAAMFASGVIPIGSEQSYINTVLSLNSAHDRIATECVVPEAILLAVATDSATLKAIVDPLNKDIYVAMDNCPHQTVILGERAVMEGIVEHLRARGLIYEILPFDRPYHTPMFKAHAEGWGREFFSRLPISPPRVELYSCTTAAPYPKGLEEIRELFVEHWMRPVRFTETIERMHADGVRLFVEVGPRGNLTAFVDDILRGAPHLAMPSNVARRSGITQLNHLVGVLAAQGIPMCYDYLYRRRDPQGLSLDISKQRATVPGPMGGRKLALGTPNLYVAPRQRAKEPARVDRVAMFRPPSQPIGRQAMAVAPRPAPATAESTALRPVVAGRVQMRGGLVMQEYVRGMESFLDVQHQVMQAFLSRMGSAERGILGGAAAASISEFPLLGTVTSLVPGQELVALRRLEKDEDLFLADHALGGPISVTDPALRPMSVVPLTISMEILAEAAAVLMPGKLLIGMRAIEAHQWIKVEEDPVTLQITARRLSPAGEEVEVYIRNLSTEADSEPNAATPVIRGIMVFDDHYPAPPPATAFPLTAERPSRLAQADLYDGRLMFHGPCFHGVASIEQTGEDGLIGLLQVLPADGLFRSIANPAFVTDPVVLDAAGQLVGYWTAEHLKRGFVVFPYQLEALHIYRGNQPVGERVSCQLKLQLLGTQRVRSDLDIIGTDGQLWMSLHGWEDRRFELPERFHRFWIRPRENLMSLSWQTPLASVPRQESFECYRLDRFFEPENSLWIDLWGSLVLSRQERRTFQGLNGSAMHRLEWLTSRTVAKDALRAFLKTHYQLEFYPADIEIDEDEQGRPVAQGAWTKRLAARPTLSLTYADGVAVALVGSGGGRRFGIHIESMRRLPPGFQTAAFSTQGQALLAEVPAAGRSEWGLRVWCAKQAVAKAISRKLLEEQDSILVQALDIQRGLVKAALQEKITEAFPEVRDAQLVAYSAREGDYIMASIVC